MNTNNDISRNAPCPCGSGKKYKRCHGSLQAAHQSLERKPDYLEISREIAYMGKIGRMRQDFCLNYISHKREALPGIENNQTVMAESKGEKVSCQKGCHFCCLQFVEAGIQEAEAIVYYLYQNTEALNQFIRTYPLWLEQVQTCGDPFTKFVHNWEQTTEGKWIDRKTLVGGLAALYEHTMANIPCPFLKDSVCSIYDVRPFTCAGCFATTPPELCKPVNRNRAHIYSAVQSELLNDTSFYYRNLGHPVRDCMPVMVYQILNYGLIGMPEIPGLEDMPREFINDPEVKPIIQHHMPDIFHTLP